MTYAELIARAIHGRGPMTNKQIYSYVRKLAKHQRWKLTPNWRATVRNTLQRHCRQSGKFVEPQLFIHRNHSVWECRVNE